MYLAPVPVTEVTGTRYSKVQSCDNATTWVIQTQIKPVPVYCQNHAYLVILFWIYDIQNKFTGAVIRKVR